MNNTMAVVKTSYTKSPTGAKASLRYIQHRPGKEGERHTRTLFGSDGALTRREAYQMIDRASEGTYFYRIINSPDPAKEDTHKDLYLREITEQTMLHLTERFQQPICYVATAHTEQTDQRHVHALALLPKTLRRDDLAQLRNVATQAAVLQRTGHDRALEKEEQEREEDEQEWEW